MEKFKVGNSCWIHGVSDKNDLVHGTVIKIVQLEGYPDEHYIIEIPTSIDSLLEIRDIMAMSDDPDKPILLWRQFETKEKS